MSYPDEDPSGAGALHRARLQTHWWFLLGAICVVALAVRLAWVAANDPFPVRGDAHQYHNGANLLVDGKGFVAAPLPFDKGRPLHQTAQHPPLYTIALAIPSALGLRSVLDHQVWSAVLGTASVGVIGLVGRRLGGPAVGIVAAAITAVYPNAWLPDGILAAETLSLLTTALMLLAAYRFWERRRASRAVELGVACALAALTRGEAVLLLPFVAFPLILGMRSFSLRQRLGLMTVASLATVATLAPWAGFNVGRFHHPVLNTTTGFYLAAVGANCNNPYYGPGIGYWDFFCIPSSQPSQDETDAADLYRRTTLRYISEHYSRLPYVLFARVGRTFGLYHPIEQIGYDAFFESRDRSAAGLGLAMYFGLVGGSVVGLVILRRRGPPIAPLVGTVATVAFSVALVYGTTRFRISAEPVFVLLTAVALVEGFRRASRWLPEPVPDQRPQ